MSQKHGKTVLDTSGAGWIWSLSTPVSAEAIPVSAVAVDPGPGGFPAVMMDTAVSMGLALDDQWMAGCAGSGVGLALVRVASR